MRLRDDREQGLRIREVIEHMSAEEESPMADACFQEYVLNNPSFSHFVRKGKPRLSLTPRRELK